MAASISIRSSTGAVTPAASAADVVNAITSGDDILVNGQTATIMDIGGPGGTTWFLNGQPVDSWFSPAAPAGGTTMTPAQVCSGMPPAPPLPTPPAYAIHNLPAKITLQTAPTLPPQPASSTLPPAGCVTLVVGGRQRASSAAMDMQSAIDGGASVMRGDGSLALIQSLTAPGWPPNNYLIDGNPITAVLGQGFLPGQLDLIHSLAAQGLTISATLEPGSTTTYPPAVNPIIPLPGPLPGPLTPIVQPLPVTTQAGDNTWLWILGGAALVFLLSRK